MILYFAIIWVIGAINLKQCQNENVEKLIVFTRHGARAPNKFTEFDEVFWNGIMPGDLTYKGFEQVKGLGHILYHCNKHLFNLDYNMRCTAQSFFLESSTKSRAMMSTIGLVMGLCPLNYQSILTDLFENYFQQFSTSESDLLTILQSNFANPYNLSIFIYQAIQKLSPDFFFHGPNACEKEQQIRKFLLLSEENIEKEKYFREQPEFLSIIKKIQQANPTLASSQPEIFDPKNVPIKKIKEFFGGYKCNLFEGKPVASFSQSEIQFMNEVSSYIFYKIQNGQDFQHEVALTVLFQKFIDILTTNSDQHFFLFSGHDTNQVAILSTLLDDETILGLNQRLPPFASYIEIAVLKNGRVQIKLNGQILKTKVCEQQIECSIDEYVLFMKKFVNMNLTEDCKI